MSTTENALRGQFGDWTGVSVLTLTPNPENQAQRLLSGSLPYGDPRPAGGLSSNHARSQRTASRARPALAHTVAPRSAPWAQQRLPYCEDQGVWLIHGQTLVSVTILDKPTLLVPVLLKPQDLARGATPRRVQVMSRFWVS